MKKGSRGTSPLPKIVVLATITIGMLVGFWALDSLMAQAAPPPPEGPIIILGINHLCQDPLLRENPLNDTYQSATLLPAGHTQTHTLDSGGLLGTHDKDWFYFSAPAGQVFTLSTSIPAASVLTTTQISLFTSTQTAYSDSPAANSLSGKLAWTSPAAQTFWVRLRNPFSDIQVSTNDFCDVIYQLTLEFAGNLDHSGTHKLAEAGPNRTITYTITLSNTGEMLEPVVVTDTLPAGVNLLSVTVSPTSVTTALLTSTTGLTWTGWIAGYSSVQFSLNATATQGITDVQNTAWITAAGHMISRTSNNVVFGPSGVFLPIIFKNW